jgi:protein dithiol oxidoreductase (disulfide-forming)
MRSLKHLQFFLATAAFMLSAGGAAALTPGKDYRPINPPQPTASGQSVEVLEFFWYGCPHCKNLQPPLEAWLKNKPADVEFKRVPTAFNASWLQLARTFFALDAMGLVDKLHQDVFAAIHTQRTLDPRVLSRDPAALFDWIAGKGIDRQKFIDTYNSFAVNSLTQRTLALTRNYDITGTPSIVVDGRYLTSPSMILKPDNTLDYPRYFQVLDEIIALARKNRGRK